MCVSDLVFTWGSVSLDRHTLSGFLSWSPQRTEHQRDGRPQLAPPACPPAGSPSQSEFWISPAIENQ